MTNLSTPLLLVPALLPAALVGQPATHHTVPAAYTSTDAVAICALPGAEDPGRNQILIGASHLQPMLGKQIEGIQFRRSAKDAIFAGGAIHFTVSLSETPRTPLQTSSRLDANVGPNAIQVFQGLVTVPRSPAEPGPTVAWEHDNVIDIPFSAPFAYTGGTLCIDILGTPQPGNEVGWWPADAFCDSLSGSKLDLGGGCGAYGGPDHDWSSVARRSLVAGGYANFSASGPPGGVAIAACGERSTVGVPLPLLGLPSPGCELHLASIFLTLPAIYESPVASWIDYGFAHTEAKLPGIPGVLGMSLTTQWFDLTHMVTSNAIEWTVAPTIPTLDMASVEGHPLDTHGYVSVVMAHVVRFVAR